MSPALAIALAIPWGSGAAWLWLRATRRAAVAAVRGGGSRVGLRLAVAAILVFAPALLVPTAAVGSLVGFAVARNVLVLREIGGARAGG